MKLHPMQKPIQRKELIDKNQLFELTEYILPDSENELYESFSEMEKEIVRIKTLSEFEDYLGNEIANGKTFRFKISGWAIIFIHLEV